MKKSLLEFIALKIADVERAIKAREESEKSWRGGTDKAWKAVGCRKTKPERIKIAELESRILVRLREEREMFQKVFRALNEPTVILTPRGEFKA